MKRVCVGTWPDEHHRTKCSCNQCGGHLEFETAYLGRQVARPHRGNEAPASEPAPATGRPVPRPPLVPRSPSPPRRARATWAVLTILCLPAPGHGAGPPNSPPARLTLNVTEPVFKTDECYLSVTIDTGSWVGAHWWGTSEQGKSGGKEKRSEPLNLRSPLLQKLARELGPAYLRVGGTAADQTYYDFDDSGSRPRSEVPARYKWVATREQWENLREFLSATGLKLMLTLNAGPGPRDSHGNWQSEQARLVLAHARQTGLCPSVLELGNEVNAYWLLHGFKHQISAGHYARDYSSLKVLASSELPGTRVAGPSSAYWPLLGEPFSFCTGIMSGFLKHSDLPVDLITWHYYPTQSRRLAVASRRASLARCLKPSTLDNIDNQVSGIMRARQKYQPRAEVWLAETGPAQGGGQPELSDRFASSFWWVNTLGTMARQGQKVVARQSLVGSDYGLLEEGSFRPRPDYWASWLWKRWMGARVLAVELDGIPSQARDGYLRAYAHSLRGHSCGVALLIMNMSWDRTRFVTVPSTLQGLACQQYIVSSPHDEPLSARVLVNGQELLPGPEGQMPLVRPITSTGSNPIVSIPPLSYQFLLFPDARLPTGASEGEPSEELSDQRL